MTIKTNTNGNQQTLKPTLKIYRTDGAQPGWENRFDAIGSGTYFLHEEIDYSPNQILPKVGDRLGESKRFSDGNIYHRQSNWLITKVQCYPALDTDSEWEQIVFCDCKFEAIEAEWKKVPTLEELFAESMS
jgi:hypothetical protein